MKKRAALLLPEAALSECLFGAIVRDTRGVELSDDERINYFPASPLVTVTWVIEGDTQIDMNGNSIEKAKTSTPLPAITVSGPRSGPFVSWNPGPVLAISIGFYPDAWMRLTGSEPTKLLDKTLTDIPIQVLNLLRPEPSSTAGQMWGDFQTALSPQWANARHSQHSTPLRGRLSDWSRVLIVRSIMSGPGKTARAIQRRLKRWSGQSRRSLEFFAQIEEMHRLAVEQDAPNSAELALDAGFSDQSHMGRALRKATGFSPVRLNERVQSEEAFWCYRLLGERF
ncbi:MAG: helix-turn-helix domain-containing protein [Henriciella sp.]